ncbi:MAG: hypothetical protein K9M98_11240 [Cephaloticoccus sp.]|nr:hypothetical protein [Cephaloticoccus sp.]MCF7761064.1 hypothetical protein [Cephaloticoccus sp.]
MTEIASPPLYRLAARARDQAGTDRDGRDAALVAITFSFIALEAAINDLTVLCGLPDLKRNADIIRKCAQVLAELDEKQESLPLKLSMLHAILADEPFDKGARPWQDLDSLIKLRNLVIHRRPAVAIFDPKAPFGLRLSQPKVLQALFGKKLISEDEATRQFWSTGVQKKEVAAWAVATSVECFGAIVSLLPDSTPRDILAGVLQRDLRPLVDAEQGTIGVGSS